MKLKFAHTGTVASCILLATSWNVASASSAVSCNNISDYLDCTSVGRKQDVVFVFDTTGSMSGEIAEMQTAVIEFSDAIATAGIDYNLGLTEYRYFPACGSSDNEPYNIYNDGVLTDDANEMRGWIESLSAGGGGDESVLAALAHSVSDQHWRSDASRIAVLIGDEAPAPDGDPCNEEGNTVDGVISILRNHGVITHVIGPDDDSMRRIADETGGSFFEIRTTDNITGILDKIAKLISCSYRINSSYAYKDGELKIETALIGTEEKTLPHLEGGIQLEVTACGEMGCDEFGLTPEITGDKAVYKHTADVTAFEDSAKLTDLSTLVSVCDFSVTTQATLHIGECEAGVTPTPQSPIVSTFVNGNDANVSWTTDPFAREYFFYYAPYSDPMDSTTYDNVNMMNLGLQTSIGGSLADGTHLYVAAQSSNCSGPSDFSNIEEVEIK
ncbi:vWA domain-containing protein [Candidatus Marithioploca araucensis]|uniref:VWA domain-containing protein n=1 Tax=Candidatus Marithioploca araucensis TaxID=70273 RepID=A0ABT7VUD5_9GAMM|nr:vWA domain-containing protein [Candidatus Marithioploca araucensis]